MAYHLPVPPELQHLIEKREEDDRRKAERRSDGDRRESDLGPIGSIESVEDLEQLPLADRRAGEEQRRTGERREDARRTTDSEHPDSDARKE